MASHVEIALTAEFDPLFSLPDRMRAVADQIRARLRSAGLELPLETEVFDNELELRGGENSHLLIRLDSYRLEITGAPPDVQVHLLAALILDEAQVYRLVSVDAGFAVTLPVPPGRRIDLVHRAFLPVESGEPMLDRRFSMTWEWGNPTTGFSFLASVVEDREIFLSFKAREGYMTVPELRGGAWMNEQAERFDGAVSRFLAQLGWRM